MRLLKKICTLVLIIGLVWSVSGVEAFASTSRLTVCGKTITSSNRDILGDGTLSYNATTKTLTMNNSKIDYKSSTDMYEGAIYCDGDLNIVIRGNNSITSNCNCVCIEGLATFTCDNKDTDNKLTLKSTQRCGMFIERIKASGKIDLDVTGGVYDDRSCGIKLIHVKNDIDNIITDGAVVTTRGSDATVQSCGISSYEEYFMASGIPGDLIISNGATLKAIGGDVTNKRTEDDLDSKAYSAGVDYIYNMKVVDGARLECIAGNTNSVMLADSSATGHLIFNIDVSDGQLYCKAGNATASKGDASSTGISACDLQISNGGVVEAYAGKSSGKEFGVSWGVEGGDLNCKSGTLIAEAKAGTTILKDGQAQSFGLSVNGDNSSRVSGNSKITAKSTGKSESYGIGIYGTSLYITGNTKVVAKGDTKNIDSNVSHNPRNTLVSSLSADQLSSKKVKLSWKGVSGAKEYKVYCKANNGKYKLKKTTSNTSCTIGDLKLKGNIYTFKIVSVSNATVNGKKLSTSSSASGKTIKY